MQTIRLIRSLALCALLSALVAGCVSLASPARAANLITLASFNGPNGQEPSGGLIADADGNLYGTTLYGGASGRGTVFKLVPGTGVLTLASFNGPNGKFPRTVLIADADGSLYGTTSSGGASDLGTVFKFAAATGAITTLASFNGANGNSPIAGLIADADGNLYGTTEFGGASSYGTVFKVDPAVGAITTLASFNGANGRYPAADLIADANGALYGTTFSGGTSDRGTVFKVDPATGALATLASFNGANGKILYAGLIADSTDNLYGTTESGGASDHGTVFKVDPDTGALATLASFNGANGSRPRNVLIADADGNLYGTTYRGGASNLGTVFKLDPATGDLTTLASFDSANGRYPSSGLIADADGNLYGVTAGGGPGGAGTVFKLTDTGFVVPEPASLSLVALGAVAMVRRRYASRIVRLACR